MVIGSFLNVCITRIPENVSIILPGSRCPKCGTAIRPYDNVRLLPDLVTWPGFAVGLMFSWVVPPRDGFAGALGWRFFHRHLQGHLAGLLDGILGAAFGSFLLWGLAAGYKLVRKREGMGMGDVKMMAMVAAFVGLRGAFWTILLVSLLGSAIGVSVVRK